MDFVFPIREECEKTAEAVKEEVEAAIAGLVRLKTIGLKVEDVFGVFILNMSTLRVPGNELENLHNLFAKMIRSMRATLVTLPEFFTVPPIYNKILKWKNTLKFYDDFVERMERRSDGGEASTGTKVILWCASILVDSHHDLNIHDLEIFAGWILTDFLTVLDGTLAEALRLEAIGRADDTRRGVQWKNLIDVQVEKNERLLAERLAEKRRQQAAAMQSHLEEAANRQSTSARSPSPVLVEMMDEEEEEFDVVYSSASPSPVTSRSESPVSPNPRDQLDADLQRMIDEFLNLNPKLQTQSPDQLAERLVEQLQIGREYEEPIAEYLTRRN